MRKFTLLLFALVLVSMSATSFVTPALAQATRTWVSGVGDDVNPCSRTAPCKTFPGAISKTAAGGEINVLDPGGFGGVTITKSITISSEGFEAGVLVAGTNGITVNTQSTDVVILRGLDIEGLGSGINGISFIGAGTLHVEKSVIHHFTQNGINFAPSSGNTQLFVTDSIIRENGNSPTVAGILIRPTSTATVSFKIDRSEIENNTAGLRVDTSAPGGMVRGVFHDSIAAGSVNNGVTAVSGASVAQIMIDHSSVAGNNNGIVVNGGAATINTTYSSITGNNNGMVQNGGTGTLNTYHTNALNNNTSDGAFTNFISPQ